MPDSFYLLVDGIAFDNKFQAIQAANGKMSKITFNAYPPEFFSKIYWKQEPSETLDQLIKLRCEQLRDTYSYIRVMYSGGADSTTMLNAFIKNKIHVDEVHCYRYALDDNFNNSSNIELNNYTIPYYNKLSKILPKTKFTVADYGEKYFEPVLNDEWFAKRGTTVLRYFHDYEILDNKDNFCNLFAETTPNLDFRNNNWYAIYTDGVYRPYSNLTNIELFFSSSDLPKLDVKQTYMLKNFCKINNITDKTKFEKAKIGVIRNTPIAPDAPYQANSKLYYGSAHFLMSVKTKMLLKETKNINLKRKYIDLLKHSTLGNKLVHFYANKYIKFAEVKLN